VKKFLSVDNNAFISSIVINRSILYTNEHPLKILNHIK